MNCAKGNVARFVRAERLRRRSHGKFYVGVPATTATVHEVKSALVEGAEVGCLLRLNVICNQVQLGQANGSAGGKSQSGGPEHPADLRQVICCPASQEAGGD
jgi:hypothetical protein